MEQVDKEREAKTISPQAYTAKDGQMVSMDGKGRVLDNVMVMKIWRMVRYEEVYLKSHRDMVETHREMGMTLGWCIVERKAIISWRQDSGCHILKPYNRKPWSCLRLTKADQRTAYKSGATSFLGGRPRKLFFLFSSLV